METAKRTQPAGLVDVVGVEEVGTADVVHVLREVAVGAEQDGLAGVANAVGAGLVSSLAKPGGNITGFTSQQDEVLGKLVGILHEVVPAALSSISEPLDRVEVEVPDDKVELLLSELRKEKSTIIAQLMEYEMLKDDGNGGNA